MKIESDVLVVGAGITGLTAAFRLNQRSLRVRLIDASRRVGGVIGTQRAQGAICELGPNSILETNALIGELLRDARIEGERIEMNAQCARRYVVRDGTLVELATSPSAFLKTPLFSMKAKLRLLREPFIDRARADAEESVAQFVTRRLGTELLDYAIEPFVAGVYAGVPEELSVVSAFPKLHALEQRYGSLIKGHIFGVRERRREAASARHLAKSFSFRNGMQTLVDALAQPLPAVHLDTRAVALRSDSNGAFEADLEGNLNGCVRARAVVLAIPAYETARLIASLSAPAAAALKAIPYAPVASVARIYARRSVAHALDGFGFLVPRIEKRNILGTLFSSSMFEGRASEDDVLLTTFIGGRRQPQLASNTTSEIDRLVDAELGALLGTAGAPRFSTVTRWPRAIAQYTLGHAQRILKIDEAERATRGLYLRGSYRGGVAVGDCIRSGHEAADAVTAYLS
jgi:oxygen-dependent protoporphyrinogen oxidase